MTLQSLPCHDTMTPDRGRGLSSAEMACQLAVTPYTVRKWAREGKLWAYKVGDDWRFDPSGEEGVMGRGKEKSKLPKYLVTHNGSPNIYIKYREHHFSTGTDNEVEALIQLGKLLEKDKVKTIMFHQLIARYLDEESTTKRSGKNDRVMARKSLEFWPDKIISTFSIQDLYQYQDWRKVQHVQPKREGIEPTRLISGATVNRELALVKHSLKKAVRWGYIQQSPIPDGQVEGCDERKRERYITNQEIAAIKSQGRTTTLSGIIDVLYFTAQRSGRVLGLLWRQVNLQERKIVFEKNSDNKNVAEIIYINDPLLAILQELWEERKRQALISPWVFCHKDGSAIKSIRKAWATACRKASVEDARIHDIRHKAITDMRRAGISEDLAMMAAGHKTRQMSARYTHYQVEDIRPAFEALK
jgi:excisionase family DNA binding protein